MWFTNQEREKKNFVGNYENIFLLYGTAGIFFLMMLIVEKKRGI